MQEMPLLNNALHIVSLESEKLSVMILPEIGFKIGALRYKPKEMELLARPLGFENVKDQSRLYQRAYPGAPFSAYDVSGIDDCIPTVKECSIRDLGHFADHGDAWSRAWNVFEEDRTTRSMKAYFRLSAIPLYFERHVQLKDDGLLLSYRLLNESVEERPWMWSLHDLCHFEPDAILDWKGTHDVFNAQNGKPFSFPVEKMKNLKSDEAFRFYVPDPLEEGEASITYPSQGVRLRLLWDATQFPYFGGWINPGGYPSPKAIALSPSNGYFDSLARAIAEKKVGHIAPGEEILWQIRLQVEEI